MEPDKRHPPQAEGTPPPPRNIGRHQRDQLAEGDENSHPGEPRRPGRPAGVPQKRHEPPPVCPAALENPAGTRAVSDRKTETATGPGENGAIIAVIYTLSSHRRREGETGNRESRERTTNRTAGAGVLVSILFHFVRVIGFH